MEHFQEINAIKIFYFVAILHFGNNMIVLEYMFVISNQISSLRSDKKDRL